MMKRCRAVQARSSMLAILGSLVGAGLAIGATPSPTPTTPAGAPSPSASAPASPSPVASPTPAPATPTPAPATPTPAPSPISPPASAAPRPSTPPIPTVTAERPVYDASSWAAVMGPLKGLWDAWKAEQMGQGVMWDDEGHIVNLEGATIVSKYRADQVPASAIQWIVAHAGTMMPGALVAGSPADAAIIASQEIQRASDERRAAADAADQAKAAGATPTPAPSGTPAPGSGPASQATTRPGDPAAPPPTTGAQSGTPPAPGGAVDTGERVPDLVQPATVPPGSTANINGRKTDLYIPPTYQPGQAGWGLLVSCGDIVGNTDYPKKKLTAGVDAHKLIYAGINAREVSPGSFHWEADQVENTEYIRQVVRTAEGEFQLDPKRTVLFGFSNGAGMVYLGGPALDDLFEGFIAVEGYPEHPNVQDKSIVVLGKGSSPSSRTGNRWTAVVDGMGHFIPGPKVYPGLPDPGLTQDNAGNRCDGQAMLDWIFGTGPTAAGSQGQP